MSSLSLKKKLHTLLSSHTRLVKQLLHYPRLLRGSFHQVYTRCGKSTCWCAQARQGHAHARLTWSEEGTMITRKVPVGEKKTVVRLTAQYRQFREQRDQLSALEAQIRDHLDQYEKALIRETRKPLSFLAIRPKMSAKFKPALQTRRSPKS